MLLYPIRTEILNNNQIQKRIKRTTLNLQNVTIGTRWFFEDYPQREVPDVCHSLLEKMKDYAKKIYEKFPVEYSAE